MTRRSDALPWISLIVVYLVWGSTYLGIRVAVTTIPPYLMTGIRYLIAGSLLFALHWIASKEKLRLPSPAEMLRIAIVAVSLLVIGNGLLCLAETRVESGTSALLLASTPIWMLLLDALLARKPPSTSAIAGVLLGTAGIALLVGKGAGHVDVVFAGVILIASIFWAAGSIFARGNEHSGVTTSLEMVVGGGISLVVGLLLGEASHVRLAAISGPSLWGMVWLITAGAMLGYSAYAYAVRTLPTATVSTYGNVNPVVAVILGAVILREPVTWNIIAGGSAVIASVVLILLGGRPVTRRDRASSSPSA
ncbi:MAG: EamA family transporter [Candidatus Eremiobacteraeota bacterium]|nr:EamA family transporter [Candidatus Eremiobacteraeota bacterium]